MVTEGGLNLKEIIEFLELWRLESLYYKDWTEVKFEDIDHSVWRKDDFRCELHWQKVKLYDIDALSFLSFAKQDIKEDSKKGRADALGNANRALNCRVDELLTFLNLKSFPLRGWNEKTQVLKVFGVSSPDILRRLIGKKRNLLEHEYKIPQEQREVEDAIEVAELFLEATRPYVERGYIASAIVASTSWFKPGDLAPTWFGRGIGEKSRRYEYRDGFSERYKLEFDLNKAITLSYSFMEVYGRLDLKTGELQAREWEEKESGKGPVTTPIRECKMDEVRELMIPLRERGGWA